MSETDVSEKTNFIREKVKRDLAEGLPPAQLQTRFPPEPNGYLHIGHAKAICLSFGLAAEFGGRCNLRFDDTNPENEDTTFVEGIREDIRWLGWQWDAEHFASDYFEQLYTWAVQLIRQGDAYVCELSAEETKLYRGDSAGVGRNSPWRERPVEESLRRFQEMRAGEHPDGSMTLRAKIDMASPNLNLRDPVMYRIKHCDHHRTGNAWHIYPSYDFAHGQSDSLERVTHSLCSLEFEAHRPLYDWFIQRLGIFPSQQTEFSRLSLTYTVMSKRKLRQLVETKRVNDWDDPRMPTLRGLRRRGVPPAAIRLLMETIGLTRYNAWTDLALLDFATREVLNTTTRRRMAVLDPLKVILTNLPEDFTLEIEALNNPEDPADGSRMIPFSREIWIERDDFREDAPKKFFRLVPGGEVRLRHAYLIRCTGLDHDADGRLTAIHATADLETLGKNPTDRKVKGVIHWVSAPHAVTAEVRLYDRLFTVEKPEQDERDYLELLNPDSLQVTRAFLEPSLAETPAGEAVQFERLGYFCADPDSSPGRPVFNRTVSLKDSSPR